MQYIRVRDVEKLIDRDRNTILRWEREGKIPHPQKDSRGWRFYTQADVEQIKKFMQENIYHQPSSYPQVASNNFS